MNFEEGVRWGGILFSSGGRALDTNLPSYGEFGELLCSYLARQSGNDLTVHGTSLRMILENPKNLCSLADFLVGVAFYREEPTFFHVSVDARSLEYHYQRKEEDCAVNLAGTVKIDMAKWCPQLSGFDYAWNVSLLDSFSRAVGTGFEWPRNEAEFKECVASHSAQFVVGLAGELARYLAHRSYSDDDTTAGIEEMVRRFTA